MTESVGSCRGDAGTVAWRRLGRGEPLLLINGYAATKADWDPTFLGELGAFADLICPDNRGVGESTAAGSELTVELMAADLVAVLDALEIERAPVLGWSMGGFIAQQLAAAAPERVESLILLSTDPGGSAAIPAAAETWAALTDHGGTPREQASRLISLLFPPGLAAGIDEQFGDLVAAARAELSEPVLSAQEEAMEHWHRRPAEQRLAAITAPALCAAGADDVVIPAANTALLAAELSGAWRATFPGAGHAFMAQDPDRLARLIRAFLAR